MSVIMDERIHAILHEAVSSEHGIQILVEPVGQIHTPVSRARALFVRHKADDAAFDVLQIKLAPDDPEHRLWIVKMAPGYKPERPDEVDIDLSEGH